MLFKLKHLLLVTGGLLGATLAGQAQNLAFEDDFHNFGEVSSTSTNISYEFQFENKGDAPVTINEVETSCGCTSPNWPEEPIKPGEQEAIKVVFSPAKLDGFFQKNVTVKTEENHVYNLMIEGIVRNKAKQRARARKVLPIKKGLLQFSRREVTFGNVENETRDSAPLMVYNGGNSPITIKSLEGSGAFALKDAPVTLKSEEKTELVIYYTPVGRYKAYEGSYGSRDLDFSLKTNDPKGASKSFNAKSRLYPNIEQPDPDAKRPRVELEKRVMNFGEVSSGFYIKTGVKVTNTGKKPLRIYGTDAKMCSCTAPVPPKQVIKPGESTELDIDFNAKNFNGVVEEEVQIYTNDPEKPYSTVLIKAFVES